MGFLKGLFGTKDIEATVSMARAKELFEEKSRDEEKKLCKRTDAQRSAILAKLNDIRAAFAVLKDEKPAEQKAVASIAVKDRFVEKAMNIISEFNAKEFSSLEDIERFVSEVEKRVEEIRISPREALHVRFFFEESSSRISNQTNDLVKITGLLKKTIEPLATARASIERCFKEYTDSKKSIQDAKERIATIDSDRATALSRKITPKPFDPSGLYKLRAELKGLESRRGLIWQGIDSYFSGADKILKKWLHVESDKENLVLIAKYVGESPHRAVVDDPDFRIKDVIKKALSKSEEIRVDEKDILKTESLLGMFDEIKRLRDEQERLEKQIDYVRQTVKAEEFLESQHKADVDRAKAVEKALQDQMSLQERLKKGIEGFDEASVKARLDLERELGRFLGQKLKIYDDAIAAQ